MRRWLSLLLGLVLLLATAPGRAGAVAARGGAGVPASPAPGADGLTARSGAREKPAPPRRLQVGGSGAGSTAGAAGTIWVGATPPGWDPATDPVVVFVQGLNGRAENWWTESVYYGRNDMYDLAYWSGYQTAFVDLYDSDGNPGSMWANGALLASQIRTIADYFGVDTVSIVAHSKGGIDANAAIVHYGAAPRVDRVVTLGSPHWGSPLADLAYSSWAGWLAELLGARNDGVYVLQTGYMEYFRSLTDHRAEDRNVQYLTGAGTRWGPFPSALWLGGLALSAWGQNDGLVPLWSARKPGAAEIFVRDLDHDQIRVGRYTWHLFEPYLRAAGPSSQPETGARAAPPGSLPEGPGAVSPASMAPGAESEQMILRGGYGTAIIETIPIEGGVGEVHFQLLASHASLTAWVVSPTGQRHDLVHRGTSSHLEVLPGARAYSARVTGPAAGTWTLHIQAGAPVAYLAETLLKGVGATATLAADRLYTPGQAGDLRLDLSPTARKGKLQVRATLRPVLPRGTPGAVPLSFEVEGEGLRARPSLPAPGIYLVEVTVTGTLADGSPFERSLVRTVAAAHPGDRSPEHLQRLGP
nr:MAG: hypothetical protein DIU70_10670 [Bacillota bacterium]